MTYDAWKTTEPHEHGHACECGVGIPYSESRCDECTENLAEQRELEETAMDQEHTRESAERSGE